jgi:tRNA(Arg) A34 adenosine deaminase TadA
MTDHEKFMQMAIDLAKEGMEKNAGGPFGCVIVKNGEVVGKGHNEVTSSFDPTAHAEIVAIRRATKNLNDYELKDCILYTSCEPCPMCLGAIYWSRPDKVFYACTKEDAAAVNFDDQFIYEEIEKPFDQREIPMENVLRQKAVEVFKEWELKEDKTPY